MKHTWTMEDDLQNFSGGMLSAIPQVISDGPNRECYLSLGRNWLRKRSDHLLELVATRSAVTGAAMVAFALVGCSSHSTPASGEEIERAVYLAEQASIAAKSAESEEKRDLQVQELALIAARAPELGER